MNRRIAPSAAKALALSVLLSACAGPAIENVAQPTQSGELSQTYQVLAAASQDERALLAPNAFSRAMSAYDEASKATGETQQTALLNSRLSLEQFEAISARHSERLAVILEARRDAQAVDADENLSSEFQDLDGSLENLASVMEKNPDTPLAKWLESISQGYRDLELRSLKSNILDEAEAEIARARLENVDDFAPVTLNLAEEEMLMGISVLERDRSRQSEARQHAANSLAQVDHARQIMAQVQAFEAQDASYEDILIWHEAFVREALSGLLPPENTSLPPASKLNAAVENLLQSRLRAEAETESLRSELAIAQSQRQQSASVQQEMEQQVLAAQMAAEGERRIAEQRKMRLQAVQDLFAPTEADVYQQGENILIRAHGFEFETGSAIVQGINLPLISKVISAIELFPHRQIRVTGHTDSLGNDELNKALSTERAENVASMLSDIGLIEKGRFIVEGLGESQPVANNETSAGRAANRRVEIELLNEG